MHMQNLKGHVPNFFTSLNAVSGFVAIVYAFQSDFLMAFYAIGAAAFFDFIDGGVARLLHTESEVGKQLDSLCDVISFGVAPGVILLSMMRHALGVAIPFDVSLMDVKTVLLMLSMVLVPVFSAIRLAKFNVDTRQSSSFIGLPVPANAIFIAALGVLLISPPFYFIKEWLMQPYVLLVVALVQSSLLVSPLPMFALKFKNLRWKTYHLQFLFLFLSAGLIFSLGILGVALTIVVYVVLSLILRLLRS